ncbi:MAG: tRNA (adenosine(37)-N6)-threonylcarbamoyltransferase complex ATPase subunit type 1 TsaE [Bacteroidales bacterium]|nr:tRNA (adenosine(37)-N6)-threonylcarbamoyltransferase complex ATPase subunit type 1 TsaE [Bacteroidales bacterium]MBN2817983.1 tRNA (adenosine(37)-N6)-threonylcarbamoyltransferase complex ATPase subunit type 1 TsaE [Bacteroidales bacterium]
MSEFELILDLEKIDQVAKKFIHLTSGKKKFAFYGQMGAGKTTFITALCHELKATDLVSSPTFSIVNEYQTENQDSIYHFDFYRINDTSELYDIGFEEYCYSDCWCFIEWPERGEAVIPQDFINVRIHIADDNKRRLVFQIH